MVSRSNCCASSAALLVAVAVVLSTIQSIEAVSEPATLIDASRNPKKQMLDCGMVKNHQRTVLVVGPGGFFSASDCTWIGSDVVMQLPDAEAFTTVSWGNITLYGGSLVFVPYSNSTTIANVEIIASDVSAFGASDVMTVLNATLVDTVTVSLTTSQYPIRVSVSSSYASMVVDEARGSVLFITPSIGGSSANVTAPKSCSTCMALLGTLVIARGSSNTIYLRDEAVDYSKATRPIFRVSGSGHVVAAGSVIGKPSTQGSSITDSGVSMGAADILVQSDGPLAVACGASAYGFPVGSSIKMDGITVTSQNSRCEATAVDVAAAGGLALRGSFASASVSTASLFHYPNSTAHAVSQGVSAAAGVAVEITSQANPSSSCFVNVGPPFIAVRNATVAGHGARVIGVAGVAILGHVSQMTVAAPQGTLHVNHSVATAFPHSRPESSAACISVGGLAVRLDPPVRTPAKLYLNAQLVRAAVMAGSNVSVVSTSHKPILNATIALASIVGDSVYSSDNVTSGASIVVNASYSEINIEGKIGRADPLQSAVALEDSRLAVGSIVLHSRDATASLTPETSTLDASGCLLQASGNAVVSASASGEAIVASALSISCLVWGSDHTMVRSPRHDSFIEGGAPIPGSSTLITWLTDVGASGSSKVTALVTLPVSAVRSAAVVGSVVHFDHRGKSAHTLTKVAETEINMIESATVSSSSLASSITASIVATSDGHHDVYFLRNSLEGAGTSLSAQASGMFGVNAVFGLVAYSNDTPGVVNNVDILHTTLTVGLTAKMNPNQVLPQVTATCSGLTGMCAANAPLAAAGILVLGASWRPNFYKNVVHVCNVNLNYVDPGWVVNASRPTNDGTYVGCWRPTYPTETPSPTVESAPSMVWWLVPLVVVALAFLGIGMTLHQSRRGAPRSLRNESNRLLPDASINTGASLNEFTLSREGGGGVGGPGPLHPAINAILSETAGNTPDSPQTVSYGTEAPLSLSRGLDGYPTDVKDDTGFTLGKMVGAGASGRVYEAIDKTTGELIAVKEFVFADAMNAQRQLASLQREVRIMKSLKHPNVVRYLGAESRGTTFYLMMEMVPGGSVKRLIDQYGIVGSDIAVRMIRDIVQALIYIHSQGLIHRDIKSANLLRTTDGTVKVADFGATRQFQTVTGISGTPAWMAPEVIRGEPTTSAADVWALGCVAMELFTGNNPFAHVSNVPAGVLHHVTGSDPISLPHGLSPQQTTFLEVCLRRDASSRPSAEELLKQELFAGTPPNYRNPATDREEE